MSFNFAQFLDSPHSITNEFLTRLESYPVVAREFADARIRLVGVCFHCHQRLSAHLPPQHQWADRFATNNACGPCRVHNMSRHELERNGLDDLAANSF